VSFETRTRATIEAARRGAFRQYQAERKSFAQRLHNERNFLIRDVDRQILTIENKYNKLYRNVTKRSEKRIGEAAEFRAALHNHIRRSIAHFEAELKSAGVEGLFSDEDQEVQALSPRPPSSRRDRASSVRRARNPHVDMALSRASKACRHSQGGEDI
jgi:hypothetical protein